MKKQQYNIITADMSALKKSGDSYIINYSNPRERRKVIIAESSQDDCALFYQIQQVLKNTSDPNTKQYDADSLKEVIFYADFSSADLSKSAYKYIFENGVFVSFKENTPVLFMPFDKSNSMSRSSKMTFLSKDLVKDVNKRLMLSIDFSLTGEVELSKFYAYKGNYLTSSERINPALLNLDSDKFVVIKDKFLTTGYDVLQCSGIEDNGVWSLTEPEKAPYEIAKLFDGEGIISEAFYTLLNSEDALNNKSSKASSFQIRMPFVKGMLHYVDFHGFLREYATLENDTFIIKDAFGTDRDLMKAEIIVPESMFKCIKWLKKAAAHKNLDAMEVYFDGFKKYGHSLYIVATNAKMGASGLTKLNYQFLNTLKLSKDELSQLVDEHLKYVKDPSLCVNNLSNISETGDYIKEEASWQLLLIKDSNFRHERSINSKLKSMSNTLGSDIGIGHLITEGTVCYLSRDPVFFLIDLLRLSPKYAGLSLQKLEKEVLKGEHLMPYDCVYMPGSTHKIDFKSNHHYPIFRNPHLSRNEQCALRFFTPPRESIYNKYLGHLKGVCIIGYSSVDPQALGGADFDGDLVKVFCSDIIRNAVLRGAYDNYERKLPIVNIPEPTVKEAPKTPSDIIDFEVIKNTFSGKIGQISNLASRLGQIEYNENATKAQKENLSGHSCAECTLLTGLEIDAAKTGVHPSLSAIFKVGDTIKDSLKYDYKNDCVDVIKSIRSSKVQFNPTNLTVTDGTHYAYKRLTRDKINAMEYTYDKSFSVINLLPKYFFDSITVKMEDGGVRSGYAYFDFMRDEKWRKNLDSDLVQKIAEIVDAYNKVIRLAGKLAAVKLSYTSGSFETFSKFILKLQYDDERTYLEDYDSLSAYLDDSFDSTESVKAALNKLTDCAEWFYNGEGTADKVDVLRSILGKDGLPEREAELLCNFSAQGYMILYYLLSDVYGVKISHSKDNDCFEEITESDAKKPLNSKLYAELLSEYRQATADKKDNWRKELLRLCETKINALMEECSLSRDDIMPYLYSLTYSEKADSNGHFFWNYYSSSELLARVCVKPEKERE